MKDTETEKLNTSLMFYEKYIADLGTDTKDKIANYLKRGSSMIQQYGLPRTILFIMSNIDRETYERLESETTPFSNEEELNRKKRWTLVFNFTTTITNDLYGWSEKFSIDFLRKLIHTRKSLPHLPNILIEHYSLLAKITESKVK